MANRLSLMPSFLMYKGSWDVVTIVFLVCLLVMYDLKLEVSEQGLIEAYPQWNYGYYLITVM